ncbi:MAG: hypothetical protein UU87_C0003G0158 [Parcubacteria group bacterium GW2011_GWA2_42_11]|nr:MAG: hypothetical protein UU87_C0003G0158 [Parcubacteria group bacterium GW2011_GWA2_42_11]KKT76488.1 MAG: hypothetical protein UW72_C0005G0056 [Parcubacteria group bacterium GW2011_GWF2_44_7]
MELVIRKEGQWDLELKKGKEYEVPLPPARSVVEVGTYRGLLNFFFVEYPDKPPVNLRKRGKKGGRKSWRRFNIPQPGPQRKVFISFPGFYMKGPENKEYAYGEIAARIVDFGQKPEPVSPQKRALDSGNLPCQTCGKPTKTIPLGTSKGVELVRVCSDNYCSSRSGM